MLTPEIWSFPYAVTVTIQHHENPAGNPNSRPVTFDLSDTGLKVVGGVEEDEQDYPWVRQMYPWLLLHHDPSAREGDLKEIEAEPEGHGPAVPWEGNEDDAEPELPEVLPENGFVTLAVGETKAFGAQWQEPNRLVEKGERYKLCHRGTFVRWWKWGAIESMKGEKKTEQNREAPERICIACTNLIEFSVEG